MINFDLVGTKRCPSIWSHPHAIHHRCWLCILEIRKVAWGRVFLSTARFQLFCILTVCRCVNNFSSEKRICLRRLCNEKLRSWSFLYHSNETEWNWRTFSSFRALLQFFRVIGLEKLNNRRSSRLNGQLVARMELNRQANWKHIY